MEVFVPTWNSARTLSKCLKSIYASIPEAQVTVIDRFSYDKTCEIAKQFNASVIPFRGNIGEARQFISELAKDDWFVMIDSDIYLTKSWYENIVTERDRIEDPRMGALCGFDIPLSEPFRSYWIYLFKKYNYPLKNHRWPHTSNMLVKTEAVRQFKCNLPSWEDHALGKYLNERGYHFYLTGQAVCYHDVQDLSNHTRWWGAGAAAIRGASPWVFAKAILLEGLLGAPLRLKYFAMRQYWNWFVGAIQWRKYLNFKRQQRK